MNHVRDTRVRELTVGDLLREAADAAPSTLALVEGVPDPDTRRRWTYGELLAESERAARALLGRFAPGERIAVWANNIPEWVTLELAAALAGMTLVTVNPALRRRELCHVLADSQAAGLFLVRDYRGNPMADRVAADRGQWPMLRETLLFEDWQEFLDSGSPTEALPAVRPGDPAQIQYTSGTTGTAKGAILHHRGITNSARLSYADVFDMRPAERMVNSMPLFHTAGCVLGVLSCIATLGTHVLLPYFDPALQLHLIEAERSAALGGVPTMLIAMLEHPDFASTDLSALRWAVSGGALVPPSLVRRVESAFGVPMSIIFGMTEASPGIAMTRPEDSPQDRATTVGRALPATEVRIVDPATGLDRGPGDIGELCTRGYHVMTGYLGRVADTAATIDADGWLHTGDLARMNDRGYISVEGRIKDMIIRGGENIYPREIEDVLIAHPAVGDVAVIGVPDEHWGETVAAFVRIAPDSTADEDELFAYVRGILAPHKTPRVWRFVDEFPLTGSGKIRKHVLRDHYVAESAL